MSGAMPPCLRPLWRVQCQLCFSHVFVKGKLYFLLLGLRFLGRNGRWDEKYKQRRTVYTQSGRDGT
jgi:hypothetical protein